MEELTTFCTNTSHWKGLKGSKMDDKVLLKAFAIRTAAGRVCKKTVAQLYYSLRNYSTIEMACRGALALELKDLTKEERKAFRKVYGVARAWYDKTVQYKLLNDYGFHQNAKIIVAIKQLNDGAGVDPGVKLPKHEVFTTIEAP